MQYFGIKYVMIFTFLSKVQLTRSPLQSQEERTRWVSIWSLWKSAYPGWGALEAQCSLKASSRPKGAKSTPHLSIFQVRPSLKWWGWHFYKTVFLVKNICFRNELNVEVNFCSAFSCVWHWLSFVQIWYEAAEWDLGLSKGLVSQKYCQTPLFRRPDNKLARWAFFLICHDLFCVAQISNFKDYL